MVGIFSKAIVAPQLFLLPHGPSSRTTYNGERTFIGGRGDTSKWSTAQKTLPFSGFIITFKVIRAAPANLRRRALEFLARTDDAPVLRSVQRLQDGERIAERLSRLSDIPVVLGEQSVHPT